MTLNYVFVEPGLLADLERRVAAAEAKFEEANLGKKLEQLELAKQKQVRPIRSTYDIDLGYRSLYILCQIHLI